MLRLNTRTTEDTTILEATGDLRLGESTGVWKAAVDELLERSVPVLVLDLSGIDGVDAAGIGTLLETKRQCEESGGKLVLLHPTDRMRQLLDLCGLTELFHLAGADQPKETDQPKAAVSPTQPASWPDVRTQLSVAQ